MYFDGNQTYSLQVNDETPGRRGVGYVLLFQSLYLQLEVILFLLQISGNLQHF